MELFQQGTVYSRLVVEPFQVGLGDQLDEVLVAGPVLGQDREVEGRLVPGVPVEPAAGSHVHLAPDYRFDAGALGGFVEVDGAVHPAVIRDRQAAHAKLLGSAHQGVDSAQAVEEAELCMYVQMSEQRASKEHLRVGRAGPARGQVSSTVGAAKGGRREPHYTSGDGYQFKGQNKENQTLMSRVRAASCGETKGAPAFVGAPCARASVPRY